MTELANRELVTKVKTSLGKFISKPQLTEKLLSKPPFKFLHDIITNVIRNTGYLSGVFNDEELKSQNVSTKDTKIKFLNKLIKFLQSGTNETITAKPSKIVAGLEVTKTLELLLAIVNGIETKKQSVKESCQSTTKPKLKEPVKSNIKNNNKPKILEKTLLTEKKLKDSLDGHLENVQKSIDNTSLKVDDESKSKTTDTTVKPEIGEKCLEVKAEEEENNSVKKKEITNGKLLLDSKPEHEKLTPENDAEDIQLRKLNESTNISRPSRPKSSRPPAPNRRLHSSTLSEIPKYSDNFFSKNDDKLNDIDDNIVTIELVNDAKLSNDINLQVDDQGHLVSQILHTQEEFDTKKKPDPTKVEWEGKHVKDKEVLAKEMSTVKQYIQAITKSANPLSKLVNNMQENIDQMNRELSYWKNFNQQTNEKLESAQRIAEEKINPMFFLLEKLKTDINEEMEMTDYAKANIIKNKARINYLISERFTMKK
ncbi:TRAF3-interacting protein 1 [Adelges cooleyi]|uniref:TRAF3-interacting protein 1 n=1 Tax=Adelges cooleyi TaxID=133065 RepID=UPI002180356A|nr:TRAF3-interacting protein 1 [Adelges cooleyi]